MSIEGPSTGALAIAGAGGVAALIAAFTEVALQLFGVPLPVVLAAMTGACIARSYTPAQNFFGALMATIGWTIVGCALAPIVQAMVKKVAGLELPTNALAGVALIVSAGVPLLIPILKEKVPEIVRSRLDQLKGPKGPQP